MPLMKCTAEHNYGGVDRFPGEIFEVETQYIPVLETLGRAQRVASVAAAPAPVYHTRVLTAQSPGVAAGRADSAARSRQKRRARSSPKEA